MPLEDSNMDERNVHALHLYSEGRVSVLTQGKRMACLSQQARHGHTGV